jgi:3-oxoacyl-[acyl-carrier protein] reductase/2-hydroxycyclohexanecarboxyl-CoA dehydrogenase
MKMRLKDKVAIVTGAGRGLGKGIAKKLAEEGAKVVLADMNSPDEAVAEITAGGGTASAFTVNVTKQEEMQAMVQYAIDTYGTLDIMVNNAGINKDGMLHKMPAENWNVVIDVDLTGAFYGTQEALKYMRTQGSGRIINISSGSWLGNLGQANYAAAKAGVVGLTKTAARESAQKGITCNVICPGFIETDMTVKLKEVNEGKAWDSMMERIPMGYAGQPSDVGNMVAFLASDEAAYITSEVINVGGGMIV